MLDLSSATTQTTLLLTLLALPVAFLLFQPTGFVRWLQKKNYQYEVTFSLYMLTPTEKFVFNSILFLTFSLFLIASVVYLPNHVMTMSRRTYYYFAGDCGGSASAGSAGAGGVAEKVYGTASGWAQTAYQTAFNRTAVGEGVVDAGAAAAVSASAAAAAEVVKESAIAVAEGN